MFAATTASATLLPIRIGTYNVAADINGVTTLNDAEISTVMQGIGNESFGSPARPLDILALEETTSNPITIQPVANDLNKLYPALNYQVPSFQATENGGDLQDGNGPNGIIYNASTLKLISAVGVGTPEGSTNGEYRQVARYEFAPVGNPGNVFYVYVCHAKSGSTSADQVSRGQEATIIRNDEATLPGAAGADVLYVGDFNIGASTEQSIVNLEASGSGQAFDPLNEPGNYAENSAFQGILTESATDLRYRDDLQLITATVKSGATGMQYIPNTYSAFGNNGTTAVGGTVNASSNTALTGLPNRSAVLTALTEVTDHLPVVADYDLTTSAPNVQWASTTGGSWTAAVNWTPDNVPNAQAAVANFLATPYGLTSAGTITLDGSKTVGKLVFGDTAAYTIAQGTGGTLTIDDTGDTAGVSPSITVSAGKQIITAPMAVASGVTVTTAGGTSLTIGAGVTGTGPFTIAGQGTTLLSPAGSLGLPVTVNGNLDVVANAGSTVLARTISGLNIGPAGDVVVAVSATRSVVVTSTLSIATGGTLDLTGNDMIVSGGNIGAVSGLAAAGYDLAGGGNWTGPGLTSSMAAANTTHLTALAVVENDQDGPTLDTTFDGVAVNPGDVLVKYTLVGDANLDGHVDGSDYSLIDAGFASGGTLTGWYNGDFNYDGQIDGSDYALIDNSFNNQPAVGIPSIGAADISAQVAAVPEPASLAGLGILLIGLNRRRRARRTTLPPVPPRPDLGDPAAAR
jgi:hypothetical protein